MYLFRCPQCGGLSILDDDQFEGREPIWHDEPSCGYRDTVNVRELGRSVGGIYELPRGMWWDDRMDYGPYGRWDSSGSRAVHGVCPQCHQPMLLRRRMRGEWYEIPADTPIECPACGAQSPFWRFVQERSSEP